MAAVGGAGIRGRGLARGVWVLALGGMWWWAALRLAVQPGGAGPVEGAVVVGGWGLSLLPVHCVPWAGSRARTGGGTVVVRLVRTARETVDTGSAGLLDVVRSMRSFRAAGMARASRIARALRASLRRGPR